MDYRRDKKKNPWKRAGVGAVAAVLVWVFFTTSAGAFVSRAILSFTVPMWEGKREIASTFGSFLGRLSSTEEILNENQYLRKRVEDLEWEHAEYAALAAENTSLAKMAGRRLKNVIVAGVLVKPPVSPYDTLVVDVGAELGIQVGDRVVWSGGVVAGRIAEVFPRAAKVHLFSSYGESTSAILSSSGIPLSLRGHGGGNFEAEIPRGAPVTVGDTVLLPGSDGGIIGIVHEVKENPSDPLQRVLIRGTENIFSVTRVEVVMSSSTASSLDGDDTGRVSDTSLIP